MRYRRDEAFRFKFGEPIPITFTIEKINGVPVKTSNGQGNMLDLSLGGMKISTSLSFPVDDETEINISVQFSLVNQQYNIKGKLVWKKHTDSEILYGVKFLANPTIRRAILRDLKVIRKQMVN